MSENRRGGIFFGLTLYNMQNIYVQNAEYLTLIAALY